MDVRAVAARCFETGYAENGHHAGHVEKGGLPGQRLHGRVLRTPENELCRGREFGSFGSLKGQLDGCIVYWNTKRYQLRLSGTTPVEHRGRSTRVA